MGLPTIPYLTPPAEIINEALDRLGAYSKVIGDITDGTYVAETARRNYGRILRNLLRTAHWGFARKQATLQLLGDATGQSAAPVSTFVEEPWTYAYAWPIDGVAGRWMPTQTPLGTQGAPTDPNGVPLTTGANPVPPVPFLPARFLISSSDQYPVEVGLVDWSQLPDLQRTEGVGPINRRVILTNQCSALFVYTRLVTVIEEWDDSFRQAMVASMAVILAPVAIEDPKLRIIERDKQLEHAKMIIADARVANGNDAGMPQSTDTTPDWILARNGGWTGLGLGGGANLGGVGLYLPWSPYSLGGSVF